MPRDYSDFAKCNVLQPQSFGNNRMSGPRLLFGDIFLLFLGWLIFGSFLHIFLGIFGNRIWKYFSMNRATVFKIWKCCLQIGDIHHLVWIVIILGWYWCYICYIILTWCYWLVESSHKSVKIVRTFFCSQRGGRAMWLAFEILKMPLSHLDKPECC